MADIFPSTTFTITLTEKEYHLMMLALAFTAGADLKPDGRYKHAAAELNQQLLLRERQLWDERIAAKDKKREKAPAVTPDDEAPQ